MAKSSPDRYHRIEERATALAYRMVEGEQPTLELAREWAEIVGEILNEYCAQLKHYAGWLLQVIDAMPDQELFDWLNTLVSENTEVDLFGSALEEYRKHGGEIRDIQAGPQTRQTGGSEADAEFHESKRIRFGKRRLKKLRETFKEGLIPLARGESLYDILRAQYGIDPVELFRAALFITIRLFSDTMTKAGLDKWICPINEASIEYVEAKFGIRADSGDGVSKFWNLGVKAGYKSLTWQEANSKIGASREQDSTLYIETIQEALYRVVGALNLYFDQRPLPQILDDGLEGKLLNSLKKSTWNYKISKYRESKAKKRQPEKPVILLSLPAFDDQGEEQPEDQTLPQDMKSGNVDLFKVPSIGRELAELLALIDNLPSLTAQERDVLTFMIEQAKEGGTRTLEETGKHFGITKVRIHQICSSAYKKLRTACPDFRSLFLPFN